MKGNLPITFKKAPLSSLFSNQTLFEGSGLFLRFLSRIKRFSFKLQTSNNKPNNKSINFKDHFHIYAPGQKDDFTHFFVVVYDKVFEKVEKFRRILTASFWVTYVKAFLPFSSFFFLFYFAQKICLAYDEDFQCLVILFKA